ncbi:hypothetical protein BHE74_00030045 [Ensete ventricosum]|nr:hypothetical protein BHE74_00030045 [Ensete ventricosum]
MERIPRRISTSSVSSVDNASTELLTVQKVHSKSSTIRGTPRSQDAMRISIPPQDHRSTDQSRKENRHKDAPLAEGHGVRTPEE